MFTTSHWCTTLTGCLHWRFAAIKHWSDASFGNSPGLDAPIFPADSCPSLHSSDGRLKGRRPGSSYLTPFFRIAQIRAFLVSDFWFPTSSVRNLEPLDCFTCEGLDVSASRPGLFALYSINFYVWLPLQVDSGCKQFSVADRSHNTSSPCSSSFLGSTGNSSSSTS